MIRLVLLAVLILLALVSGVGTRKPMTPEERARWVWWYGDEPLGIG